MPTASCLATRSGRAGPSPKLGATYAIDADTHVFMSYNHGFRVPSESQLFRPPAATTGRYLRVMLKEAAVAGLFFALWPGLTYWLGGGDRAFSFLAPHAERGLELGSAPAWAVLLADPSRGLRRLDAVRPAGFLPETRMQPAPVPQYRAAAVQHR